ncbi:MAG: hypothetical protein KME11_13710 [Timaviella obliquedivisa GSE-PSE-MK23-08B]|nr:hypothetical protein [Timaviella obliquedivisa GSE-PSE-MK23-08B]
MTDTHFILVRCALRLVSQISTFIPLYCASDKPVILMAIARYERSMTIDQKIEAVAQQID